MAEIALVLSNARPVSASGLCEHLFPEKNPRWLFAQLSEAAPDLDDALAAIGDDPTATALKAAPLGERIGGPAQGPLALWVVLTNAVEGRDAEFNEWYDGRHIHDVVAIPGFVAGRRYQVTGMAGDVSSRWNYLAIYEIALDRAAESLAEAAARAGGPKMPNPGYLAPGVAALPFRRVD